MLQWCYKAPAFILDAARASIFHISTQSRCQLRLLRFSVTMTVVLLLSCSCHQDKSSSGRTGVEAHNLLQASGATAPSRTCRKLKLSADVIMIFSKKMLVKRTFDVPFPQTDKCGIQILMLHHHAWFMVPHQLLQEEHRWMDCSKDSEEMSLIGTGSHEAANEDAELPGGKHTWICFVVHSEEERPVVCESNTLLPWHGASHKLWEIDKNNVSGTRKKTDGI